MLCSAAMDKGNQEIRKISSVSYSFFIYHQEPYYLARTISISASYIIIALAQILAFILPEANCWMKCCVTSNLASSLSSSVTCFLFPLHLRILQDFGQSHLQRLNLISFISISFRKKKYISIWNIQTQHSLQTFSLRNLYLSPDPQKCDLLYQDQ